LADLSNDTGTILALGTATQITRFHMIDFSDKNQMDKITLIKKNQ